MAENTRSSSIQPNETTLLEKEKQEEQLEQGISSLQCLSAKNQFFQEELLEIKNDEEESKQNKEKYEGKRQ